MFGLLISLALAAVVVVTSVAAMRRGQMEVGERVFTRQQPTFWVLTVGGTIGGVVIMMASLHGYTDVRSQQSAPPKVLERDGVRVAFPASWEPIPELEKMMGSAAKEALAVGGDGAELLILWPAARPKADAGATDSAPAALRRIAEDLKNPVFDYSRWEVTDLKDGVVVDAAYRSPRGFVLSRHIIFDPGDGMVHVAIGTCSTESDVEVCGTVMASMERSSGP